jgi:hypothetical protein
VCHQNITVDVRWVSKNTTKLCVLCNIVISSLVHHVRPDDGLTEKEPKHVVYLLTPYILVKFCCDLTYPPYINCELC